jgi:hypothetical protein
LPRSERRNRPAAPIDSASPPPSRESPPAKAFAISTGISAKTPTAAIASPSAPVAAVSSVAAVMATDDVPSLVPSAVELLFFLSFVPKPSRLPGSARRAVDRTLIRRHCIDFSVAEACTRLYPQIGVTRLEASGANQTDDSHHERSPTQPLVLRVIHTIHQAMTHHRSYQIRYSGESRCPRQKWIPAFGRVPPRLPSGGRARIRSLAWGDPPKSRPSRVPNC